MTAERERPLGAVVTDDGTCSFLVWAPRAKKVELRITSPDERIIPMQASQFGYFQTDATGIHPGALYM
ncbi:MAG: hypothetical protein WB787_11605, partial [Candidatus Acidiferrales bacterium]